MKERIEIEIRAKIIKNIILGLVGIIGFYFGLTYISSNWWLAIPVLIGAFLIYNTIDIILFPKKIILQIDDTHLFVVFSKKKKIKQNQEKILKGEYYTGKYELSKLSNIWRYKLKVNLSVAYEVIYAIYDTKKVHLIDITGDYKLKNKDLEIIVEFLSINLPQLAIGKPISENKNK